ncbi:MAG: cytidine deaminase [Bacteroidota bacterium]|nr:cytidine deaminase [Candidatus Kapabacteria bacterium]MDW8219943.1 cytidine deaminase [Bacteroidota bacterium]
MTIFATVERFTQSIREHYHNGNTLLAGLYADSIQAHAGVDGSNQRNHSVTGVQHIIDALPQPILYYSGLVRGAKALALEARKYAHAPFSNFRVGAVLIDDAGEFHQGCNVECSSYGLTICAERAALVSAVARGKKHFCGIVVAADTQNLTPPCGACRQMLYDFAPDALIILVNLQGAEKRFSMKELLPEAFSSTFL